MKIYNDAVAMPAIDKNKLFENKKISLSNHVVRGEHRDAKHAYDCINLVDINYLKSGTIIEIETVEEDGYEFVYKVVIRVEGLTKDCIVVLVEDYKKENTLYVKTAWTNKKRDMHYSLNKSRIEKDCSNIIFKLW